MPRVNTLKLRWRGIWQLHIGGCQLCEKGFRNRRGRALSYNEQMRFCRVVMAFTETNRRRRKSTQPFPNGRLNQAKDTRYEFHRAGRTLFASESEKMK